MPPPLAVVPVELVMLPSMEAFLAAAVDVLMAAKLAQLLLLV